MWDKVMELKGSFLFVYMISEMLLMVLKLQG